MWSNWFPRIFLAALAGIAYYPILDAGRVWDDHLLFAENPVLSGQSSWREAFQQAFLPFEIFYRPLTVITLDGVSDLAPDEATGNRLLHALSILLHVLVVLGLERWARSLGAQRFAAFAVAALFAVHPGISEAVCWIAGLGDLMTAVLGVWAIWCLTDPRSVPRLIMGFLLLWMAPFCKETGIVFLGVALLSSFAHAWEPRRRLVFFAAAFLVVGGSWHVLRNGALGVPLLEVATAVSAEAGSTGGAGVDLERTLLLAGSYVRLVLWPWPLNLCHVLDRGPELWWALAGLVITAGLFVGTFLGTPGRTRWHAALVPLAWLVLLGLPAVLFLPSGTTLLAERYLYVPFIGAAVLLALAASRLRETFPMARGRKARSLSVVVVAVLVLFLGLTQRRAAVWAYEDILYEDTLRREPRAVPIAVNLGLTYRRMGRDAEARYLYAQTIEAVETGSPFYPYDLHDETYPRLLFEHGTLSAQQGVPKDAERSYRRLLEIDPENERGWISLGALLGSEGRYEEAASLMRDGIQRFPRSVQLFLNLGMAQLRQGKVVEARRSFDRVLELDPGNAVARQRLDALE